MRLIKLLLDSKVLLLIAVVYSCIISILFLMTPTTLPKVNLSGIDKVVHVIIYFILISLWQSYIYIRGDFRLQTNNVAIIFMIVLGYGIIIEILQELFTANRHADIFDVVANTIGAILGIVFFRMVKHNFKH